MTQAAWLSPSPSRHISQPMHETTRDAATLTATERDRILAKSALFDPPPPQLPDGRRDLVGLSRAELAKELADVGEAPFRAKQLWHWIYHRGATDFSRMSSIARPLQQKLSDRFIISRPEVAAAQTSEDATEKFLFRFRDGQEAETVYIPDRQEDRGAVCISSQVGCTLSCRFCHTGTQRLTRNLGAGEIVGQFMAARDAYGEWPSPTGDSPRLLSTIVLMGMGEPLYNYANVAKAMTITMDGEGIALSRRRYPGASKPRRTTFEYVMLKGVNDSQADARELVRLIAGIPAKVNLIPFNPWPDSPFKTSSNSAIDRFARIVMDAGFASPVRNPRGRDILAACGQLKTESAARSARSRY
jgi:23S rRNA (adenine2503-C2)-methyltransferase